MAPNFGAGDIVRMAVVWDFNGTSNQVNVLHAILGPNVSTTDAGVLADIGLYVRAAYSGLVPGFSDLVVHNRIEVKNVSDNLIFGSLPSDANLDGGQTGDSLPADTTALIVFRTLISRVIGRVYLPVFGEAQNISGQVESATLGEVEQFGDYLMDTQNMVNGTDITYAVLRSTGTAVVPVSYRAIPTFRKQARRQPGRGS